MKKTQYHTIKSSSLLLLLKNVFLGGLLEECLMEVKNGVAKIEAIDITSSVIVIGSAKIIKDKDFNFSFGLGNIELLIKFLSSIEDNKIMLSVKENIMTIKKKDNLRKLNYLLTNQELISTKLEENEDEDKTPYIKKIIKALHNNIPLSKEFIKDYMSFVGMLKNKNTSLNFDGEETVSFTCGINEDNTFELKLKDKVVKEKKNREAFTIKINGEYLSKVFNAIDFDDEEPAVLRFAKNKPIMIENKSMYWTLIHLSDAENEE